MFQPHRFVNPLNEPTLVVKLVGMSHMCVTSPVLVIICSQQLINGFRQFQRFLRFPRFNDDQIWKRYLNTHQFYQQWGAYLWGLI